MRLLRTLNRLKDPRDLWLFLQILTMLILLPAKIRRLSLPDLLKRIDPGVAPAPRDKARLAKTTCFVDSLLKYRIFQRYGRCLLRSLLLFHFLRRQGWPVEIHFGVRRTDEDEPATGPATPPPGGGNFDITGHSWLTLDNKKILEEDQDHGYIKTFSYSGIGSENSV